MILKQLSKVSFNKIKIIKLEVNTYFEFNWEHLEVFKREQGLSGFSGSNMALF